MGLLKTGVKAIVAVKTADVIHERVLARQQAHAAAHGQAEPAATAPTPSMPAATAIVSPTIEEKLSQLERLGELRASGVLTDAEFEVQKGAILNA